MKRFYFILVSLCVLIVWFGLSFQTNAQSEINQTEEISMVSPDMVISQFQIAGNSATPALDEFIEGLTTHYQTEKLKAETVNA